MATKMFTIDNSTHGAETISTETTSITISGMGRASIVVDDTVSSGELKASLKVLESALSSYLDEN